MVNLQELIGIFTRIERAEKESPTERYARVEIDLGDSTNYVGNDLPLNLNGDFISKIKFDGVNSTSCYFKLNAKRSAKIYPGEFRRAYTKFDEVYLTNPSAQSGKKLILSVGGAFSGHVEPAGDSKVGLITSAGVDLDPVKEDGNISNVNRLTTLINNNISSVNRLTNFLNTNTSSMRENISNVNRVTAFVNTNTSSANMYLGTTNSNISSMNNILDYSGATYHNCTDITANASRFETSSTKLNDFILSGYGNDIYLGDSSNQSWLLSGGDSWGGTKLDLSTLYYRAPSNASLAMIGVR